MDVFKKIEEARVAKQDVVICIVVSTKGSAPRKTGAKMLVYETGKIFGTIGGGNVENKVIANALEVLKKQKPETLRYDLLKENMCCGGSMAIYFEPMTQKQKLYIFGAGHTGLALARLATGLDFEITVIDDRQEYLEQVNCDGVKTILGDYKQVLPTLAFDENTYIAIMTYSHALDREILAYCLGQPFCYLGMIGSLRKVEMTKKAFIAEKISTEEELKKVDMPMGLNIGAEGPEEIAVSIMAKIIAVKNKIVIE